MIPARPSLMYKRFFAWYFHHRLKKFFYRCSITGEGNIEAWRGKEKDKDVQKKGEQKKNSTHKKAEMPLILYCSHSGWWDAILAIHLSLNEFGFDGYGMMEEKQLAKYAFFSRIGMFSIVREDARAAMTSLRYAADVLNAQQRVLWMFPQGEIRHQDARPLGFYPGLGILVKMLGRVALAPVVFRYDFLQEERAEALVHIGEAKVYTWDEWRNANAITDECESTMTAIANQMKDDVLNGRTAQYRSFLQGALSIEKKYDKAMFIRQN